MNAFQKTTITCPGHYYHIYNRAVGSEKLFTCHRDYQAFLERVKKYLMPVMDFYSYCLLPNHFHFFVYLQPDGPKKDFSKIFSDCFTSYTKWFNTKYNRKGSLFMRPFKRKLITDEVYHTQLIYYIHRNPIHHHYVKDFAKWEYSSHKAMISEQLTVLKRDEVLKWFYGKEKFIARHQTVQTDFLADFE